MTEGAVELIRLGICREDVLTTCSRTPGHVFVVEVDELFESEPLKLLHVLVVEVLEDVRLDGILVALRAFEWELSVVDTLGEVLEGAKPVEGMFTTQEGQVYDLNVLAAYRAIELHLHLGSLVYSLLLRFLVLQLNILDEFLCQLVHLLLL